MEIALTVTSQGSLKRLPVSLEHLGLCPHQQCVRPPNDAQAQPCPPFGNLNCCFTAWDDGAGCRIRSKDCWC